MPPRLQISFSPCEQYIDATGFEEYEVRDADQLGDRWSDLLGDRWSQIIRFTDLPNDLVLEIRKGIAAQHPVVIEVFRPQPRAD